MTLLDPTSSIANLIYLGYTGDPAAAFHITRKRRQDRKRKQSQRNVFQCYVFGPKNAGKSALLSSFIGRCIRSLFIFNSIFLLLVYSTVSIYGYLLCILQSCCCTMFRAFVDQYNPTTTEQFAANVVEVPGVCATNILHSCFLILQFTNVNYNCVRRIL